VLSVVLGDVDLGERNPSQVMDILEEVKVQDAVGGLGDIDSYG